MQRNRRPQSRVIAYAATSDQRKLRTWAVVAAGLLTSIAIYTVAALLT